MDWTKIRTEIAAAIGQPPDQVPRPGTHEFFALMSQLEATHPDLAARVRIALAEAVRAEPLESVAEIAGAGRRARIRQRLLSVFSKPDPTQPERRRTNKRAVLAAVTAALLVLWAVGRLHGPPVGHAPQSVTSRAGRTTIPAPLPPHGPSAAEEGDLAKARRICRVIPAQRRLRHFQLCLRLLCHRCPLVPRAM